MRDPLRTIKRALSLPPTELAAKVCRRLRTGAADRRARQRDLDRPTFMLDQDGAAMGTANGHVLARLVGTIDPALLAPHRDTIAELASRALAHEFDLLGSGWTRVVNTRGLEVTDANRPEAERIAALLPAGYKPIDWHTDFKSEQRYLWDPLTWSRDQPQVVGKGIDVKLPWELSRMQHLPLLAWGYTLASALGVGPERPAPAERYLAEFRGQVLDFIAHNPPRFGINWHCAMDVGIRVAGWVLTYDLFHALGATFDGAFTRVFTRSVREHADHLANHLEWDDRIRGNHYLADVAGLLIASAYLPADDTTDRWLHFATRELVAETVRQFHPDGSNFEASTSYHRLSAEMVVYALAVLQGVTPARRDGLLGDRWPAFRPGPPSPPLKETVKQMGTDPVSVIPPGVIDRVARIAQFTEDILDRHGRDPQIGDNDSGRFFKLLPTLGNSRGDDGAVREDTRNHRHLIDAVDGFFQPVGQASRLPQNANAPASTDRGRATTAGETPAPPLETRIVRSFLGGATFDRPNLPPTTGHAAYPGMGLYVFRHGRLTTIIRCGEVGQLGHGGHAHDDQLSFVLYADGEPVVVDPGTGCYTADFRLRDQMRHVDRHNAPQTDDGVWRYTQLKNDGLFHMPDRARARVIGRSATGLVGEHVLFGKPTRREFRCWPDELEIADQPQGLAGRYAALRPAPGAAVMRESPTVVLVEVAGVTLRIQTRTRSPIEVGRGGYSPGYGHALVEQPRLSYRLDAPEECVLSIKVLGGGA